MQQSQAVLAAHVEAVGHSPHLEQHVSDGSDRPPWAAGRAGGIKDVETAIWCDRQPGFAHEIPGSSASRSITGMEEGASSRAVRAVESG